MYSVWSVTKLAAQKGHTIKQKIGTATSGRRVRLCDPLGHDVSAGGARWGFSLEAAVEYLKALPDVPAAKRPSLLRHDEAAIVEMPKPILYRPKPPAPKTFTIRDLDGR